MNSARMFCPVKFTPSMLDGTLQCSVMCLCVEGGFSTGLRIFVASHLVTLMPEYYAVTHFALIDGGKK